jgi:hypothetical protein
MNAIPPERAEILAATADESKAFTTDGLTPTRSIIRLREVGQRVTAYADESIREDRRLSA